MLQNPSLLARRVSYAEDRKEALCKYALESPRLNAAVEVAETKVRGALDTWRKAKQERARLRSQLRGLRKEISLIPELTQRLRDSADASIDHFMAEMRYGYEAMELPGHDYLGYHRSDFAAVAYDSIHAAFVLAADRADRLKLDVDVDVHEQIVSIRAFLFCELRRIHRAAPTTMRPRDGAPSPFLGNELCLILRSMEFAEEHGLSKERFAVSSAVPFGRLFGMDPLAMLQLHLGPNGL